MTFRTFVISGLAFAIAPTAVADERDDIVAEYQAVCQAAIQKTLLVSTKDPRFNSSDYKNWQRDDGDLAGIFKVVLTSYRSSEVLDADGVPYLVHGKKVRIPETATIRVSSAWRNPRKNMAVGSVVGCTSQHLLGRALDLVPDVTAGEVEGGSSTPLDLRKYLFPTLWNAARLAGFAIAEAGSVPAPCGTFEDHVHVHRR